MDSAKRKYPGLVVALAGLVILAAVSGRIHPFFGISQGLFLLADVTLMVILFGGVLASQRRQRR